MAGIDCVDPNLQPVPVDPNLQPVHLQEATEGRGVSRLDTCTCMHAANSINQALDKVAPVVNLHPKRSFFNWWSPELDDLKKATQSAHRRAHTGNSIEQWFPYHSIQEKFKYACKKARTQSWQALIVLIPTCSPCIFKRQQKGGGVSRLHICSPMYAATASRILHHKYSRLR
jgi:hypothetical protein